GAYQQTAGLWERDKVILARGKISAKDKEGNIGEEVKILVDDAREITGEQATAYQPTGKKMRPPGSKRSPAAAVTTSKGKDPNEKFEKKPVAAGPGSALAKGSSAVAEPAPERLYIRLHDSKNQDLLFSLKQSIDENKGDTEVVLVLGPVDSKQIIKLPAKCDKAALGRLQDLVGEDNVKLQ
ncbi:MAG TPA: hypothetical protein VIR03_03890, partial [Candidatus Saccharimonadales bacterium]